MYDLIVECNSVFHPFARSNKEKANYIHIRKVVKRRKKSDYHKHCASGAHSDSACEHDVIDENKDFEKGERSLLLHGVPSDWVEEEMMEDDIDFIRDVLEQKILRCVESVGIKRRVEIHGSNPIIDRYLYLRLELRTHSDGKKAPHTGMLNQL